MIDKQRGFSVLFTLACGHINQAQEASWLNAHSSSPESAFTA